jgi:hypothetical protein
MIKIRKVKENKLFDWTENIYKHTKKGITGSHS